MIRENTFSAVNPDKKGVGKEVKKVYRHASGIRVSHWINVVVVTIMLMSGLQIFNAHPKLYWGNRSDDGKAWLAMEGKATDAGERIRTVDDYLSSCSSGNDLFPSCRT